jgi:hypothetical protein
MTIESAAELSGLIVAVFGLLGLLYRYLFTPLKKLTGRLQSNSKEIFTSLPVLFAISRQWPLSPEAGSLEEVIKEIQQRLVFHRFWTRSIVDGLNLPAFQTDIEGEITWVSSE